MNQLILRIILKYTIYHELEQTDRRFILLEWLAGNLNTEKYFAADMKYDRKTTAVGR